MKDAVQELFVWSSSLSFLLQDNVCPTSSSLFMMILPTGLLSELAEICKLLVSDIYWVCSILKRIIKGQSTFQEQHADILLTSSYPQLSSVSKRVNVVDEDHHMDDDLDVTRNQQGDNIDLFDEGNESHSSTNGTRRQMGDNSEASCGPGKGSLFLYQCGILIFFLLRLVQNISTQISLFPKRLFYVN